MQTFSELIVTEIIVLVFLVGLPAIYWFIRR